MGIKKTVLPASLAPEWADMRPVSQVLFNDSSALWRCFFDVNHPIYKMCISRRLDGAGCKFCAKRKPSDFAKPRANGEVALIKGAVSVRKPFSLFWSETASTWDRQGVPELVYKKRLSNLYKYYAYRDCGDARFVNGEASAPDGYTAEQVQAATRCAARGLKFVEFWEAEGHRWNKPMYRVRNWYRWKQKAFRDIAALSPTMREDVNTVVLAVSDRRRQCSTETVITPTRR